jgi:putative addiction module component (TIGR02574 family)
MAASRDDILREALSLPENDRAALIKMLIDSLDVDSDEDVEEAWRTEIERRAHELESGSVESIPWDIVKARLVRAQRG